MPDLPCVAQLQQHSSQHLTLTLNLGSELSVLDGHFPQQPIVPGIAQVTWAVDFAREHLALNGEFRQMRKIKFVSVIMPPAEVLLDLDWQAETSSLGFGYRCAASKQTHSSGIVDFQV